MPRHNPNDIALLMDISGECTNCHHKGQARLVAYYSGEILIRCYNCKRAGDFVPDNANYNNPDFYKPWLDDEEPPDEGSSGRYTKGRR